MEKAALKAARRAAKATGKKAVAAAVAAAAAPTTTAAAAAAAPAVAVAAAAAAGSDHVCTCHHLFFVFGSELSWSKQFLRVDRLVFLGVFFFMRWFVTA